MTLSETFQVADIIEKLPSGRKDFKNYLKHKRKEMNLEELIVRLRIEKDNRDSEKRGFNPAADKANVVEHGKSSKNKKTKAKPKLGPKGDISKNKFQGKCFNCGKVGHRSVDCRLSRKNKNHVESMFVQQRSEHRVLVNFRHTTHCSESIVFLKSFLRALSLVLQQQKKQSFP